MDTTTESSTFLQSEANASRGHEDTNGVISNGLGNAAKHHERESLHASDEEEATNPYEPEDGEHNGGNTTVSEDTHSSSSAMPSSATPHSIKQSQDAAQVSGHSSHGAALAAAMAQTVTMKDHEAANSEDGVQRLTRSYDGTPSVLVASAPPNNAPVLQSSQPQKLGQPSQNTSAAFPEDVSQIVASAVASAEVAASSAPLPQSIHYPDSASLFRGNFVGGPGGPGRSAAGPAHNTSNTIASSPYQQSSPAPTAPQTTNNSVMYPFSDSYAISQGTGVNAPSFNAGHAALATANAVSASDEHQLVTIPVSDEDGKAEQPSQHEPRKRHWNAPEEAEMRRRFRRFRPQNANEKEEAEDYKDKEDEGEEAYHDDAHNEGDEESEETGDEEGSYSTGSYSYSDYYSYTDEEGEEDEDYEYYEEFYEEEVEEDEEDEEEPRIDIIDGHGHGNTLHDILYGTPKAGVNPRNDYKDVADLVHSDSPDDREAVTAKKGRRSHARRHRPREVAEDDHERRSVTHIESSEESPRSEKEEESEAAAAMALVPVREATPERVVRRHHHRKPSKQHYEPSESDEEEQQQQQQQRANTKDDKRLYKRGEPYTEGTYKPKKDKKVLKQQKEKQHYGRVHDLDAAAVGSSDSASSSSSEDEVLHEPVTAAAAATAGNAVDFSTSSSASLEPSHIDDDFTAASGSVSRRRTRHARSKATKVAVAAPLEIPTASSVRSRNDDSVPYDVVKSKKAEKNRGANSVGAGEAVVAERPIESSHSAKTGDAAEQEDASKVSGEKEEAKSKSDANAAEAGSKDAKAKVIEPKEKKGGFTSTMKGVMSKIKGAFTYKKKAEKDKKGGFFGKLCSCGRRKETKEAVSDKKGEKKPAKTDGIKEAASREPNEAAASTLRSPATSPAKTPTKTPAKSPVDHPSESRFAQEDEKAAETSMAAAPPAKSPTDVKSDKYKANKPPAQCAVAPTSPLSESSSPALVTDEEESDASAPYVVAFKEAKRRHTQTPSTSAIAAEAAAATSSNAAERKKKKNGKKASRHVHHGHLNGPTGEGEKEEKTAVENASKTAAAAAKQQRRHRHVRAVEKESKKGVNGQEDRVAAKTDRVKTPSKNIISIDATPVKSMNASPASAKKGVPNTWDGVD